MNNGKFKVYSFGQGKQQQMPPMGALPQAMLMASARERALETANSELKAVVETLRATLAEKEGLLAEAVNYYDQAEAVFADYRQAHEAAKAEVVLAHVAVAERDVEIAKLYAAIDEAMELLNNHPGRAVDEVVFEARLALARPGAEREAAKWNAIAGGGQ